MDTRTILIIIGVLFILGIGAWLVLPSSAFANKPATPTKFIQFDASDYTSQVDGNYTGSFESNVLPAMANSKTTGSFEGFLFVNGTRRFARVQVSGFYTGRVFGSVNQQQLSGAVKGSLTQANVTGALEVQDTTPINAPTQNFDTTVIFFIVFLLFLVIGGYWAWKNMKAKEWEDYEAIEVVDAYTRPILQKEYHRQIKCLRGSKSIPQDKPKIRKMFYEAYDGELIMAQIYRSKIVDVQFNMPYSRYVKELEEKSAFVRPYDDNAQNPNARRPPSRPAARPLPKISKPMETEYRYSTDQRK